MRITGDLIRGIRLGSSIAEDEDEASLRAYFVETATFRELVAGDIDLVAGDKGTGKTALYKMLLHAREEHPRFRSVRILSAVNPTGDPAFAPLASGEAFPAEYRDLWKAYIFSLVGTDLITYVGEPYRGRAAELHALLTEAGLLAIDETPRNVFSQVWSRAKRLRIKKLGANISTTSNGRVTASPSVEFDQAPEPEPAEILHDPALRLLDATLAELDLEAWVLIDRLDEAFRDYPDRETELLGALFRVYLDFKGLERLRLKLFIRSDVYRRVAAGGFINQTHVGGRKVEIAWSPEELMLMLVRRVTENSESAAALGLAGSALQIASRLLPQRMSTVETGWEWVMRNLQDGRGMRAPRNLIDVAREALRCQATANDVEPREQDDDEESLVSADCVQRAFAKVSAERVIDTIQAEAGAAERALLPHFEGRADEYSPQEIDQMMGQSATTPTRNLVESGFLQKVAGKLRVAPMYRPGMQLPFT